jgi:hypothetical protein
LKSLKHESQKKGNVGFNTSLGYVVSGFSPHIIHIIGYYTKGVAESCCRPRWKRLEHIKIKVIKGYCGDQEAQPIVQSDVRTTMHLDIRVDISIKICGSQLHVVLSIWENIL